MERKSRSIFAKLVLGREVEDIMRRGNLVKIRELCWEIYMHPFEITPIPVLR